MEEDGKKYVVYGMKAECSEGTMQNYLSTDKGHGVLFQGNPLLNANDHTPQVNLTHFGDCNSKKVYEEAMKQADEKYKADADDGFFAKAGKFIAKTATKAVLAVKGTFGAHKCELDTPLPWMFCNTEHMIDGAPALTVESQCPCRLGGIIKIVETEEEAGEVEQAAEDAKEAAEEAAVNAAFNMMPVAAAGVTMAKTALGASAGVTKAMSAALKAGKEAVESERYYIDKYVNEEAFSKINPRWEKNMDSFKEVYGEDVFGKLQDSMYHYGITDEISVLMFLSTIGAESEYGTRVTERYTDAYLEGKSYTKNTRGAGLIQVTGSTQIGFLEYVKGTLEDGNQISEIQKYIDGYKEVGIAYDNTYGNATEFIAQNYAIESATWFWAKNDKKCKLFDSNGEEQKMSINDYIENVDAANFNNLFLVSQYCVNGKKYENKTLQEICETTEDVKTYQTIDKDTGEIKDKVSFNNMDRDAPNGWKDRITDWNEAKKWIDEEKK